MDCARRVPVQSEPFALAAFTAMHNADSWLWRLGGAGGSAALPPKSAVHGQESMLPSLKSASRLVHANRSFLLSKLLNGGIVIGRLAVSCMPYRDAWGLVLMP